MYFIFFYKQKTGYEMRNSERSSEGCSYDLNKMKLDKDEKELLKSYEKGEWKSVKDLKKKKLEYQRYAKNTSAKNKRINIRLTERDLANLKSDRKSVV